MSQNGKTAFPASESAQRGFAALDKLAKSYTPTTSGNRDHQREKDDDTDKRT